MFGLFSRFIITLRVLAAVLFINQQDLEESQKDRGVMAAGVFPQQVRDHPAGTGQLVTDDKFQGGMRI
jgi:hypothetical protein